MHPALRIYFIIIQIFVKRKSAHLALTRKSGYTPPLIRVRSFPLSPKNSGSISRRSIFPRLNYGVNLLRVWPRSSIVLLSLSLFIPLQQRLIRLTRYFSSVSSTRAREEKFATPLAGRSISRALARRLLCSLVSRYPSRRAFPSSAASCRGGATFGTRSELPLSLRGRGNRSRL